MDFVRKSALLIVLLMVPMIGAQAAKLYKWTDEAGNTHYTQVPPTEHPTEVITSEPPPPQPPAEDDTTLPEGMSATDDANMKIKQKNCEAARKNLEVYKSSEKIIQDDGTEMVLSEEMRAAKLKETEQQIKLYCE